MPDVLQNLLILGGSDQSEKWGVQYVLHNMQTLAPAFIQQSAFGMSQDW